MSNNKVKNYVIGMLAKAGITVDGSNPWDIHIRNENVYDRVLMEGALGIGESYVDAWWESKALDQCFDKLFRAHLQKYIQEHWKIMWHGIRSRLFNMQRVSRAFKVGKKHYDVGNDLYKAMLARVS